MEIKKSYKADLDRHWLKRYIVGLVIALSLFVAALEFPVHYGGTDIEDDSMDDVLQEMALRKKQERQDMIAVIEPSRPRKMTQQKVKVVDKIQKDLQNIADINKKRIVGEEDGNGEKNDKTEKAEDNKPAPVAVDMGDNPLNFRIVEQLPEFPGGMSAFVKWLTDNLRYPPVAQRQKIQGRVVISFVINRDGSICDLKVTKSVHPLLDNEAMRVARMMPKWKPGVDKNRPCRTLFAIPVEFKL